MICTPFEARGGELGNFLFSTPISLSLAEISDTLGSLFLTLSFFMIFSFAHPLKLDYGAFET